MALAAVSKCKVGEIAGHLELDVFPASEGCLFYIEAVVLFEHSAEVLQLLQQLANGSQDSAILQLMKNNRSAKH